MTDLTGVIVVIMIIVGHGLLTSSCFSALTWINAPTYDAESKTAENPNSLCQMRGVGMEGEGMVIM